ncbi:uncharacterized protein [Blastocystis hominis]|uniref:DNA 3'-5' helicase n=1 Tax=Blastocystis hominis TaxID=12968 RepID=D8M0M0_BLAHO|nr:uncharacterized protein [Blastocystis hominis]CBK21609.2 unnamed protein product [Blastocystis hominis]|eukprot:XP_012895657.1 uncharacterized protein [Blastocystis hominis]
MKTVLTGRSVFCIMPTGGGKSLCYQLPALLLPGITVVVSPLISLVQDQIRGLQEVGVEVGAMTGSSGGEVPSALWNSVRTRQFPRLKLVYTTPEKLNKSESMKNLLRALSSLGFLSLFVIDEVHCMSQWGHDFRVDYKELGKVRFEFFQNVPLMAFTATATVTVKNDILKLLLVNGKEILVFQKSFNRPELRYEVRSKKNHRQFISDVSAYILSKQLNNTGIIYCGTQMACEKVCKDLQEAMKNEGYERKIGFYHAGLEPMERERIQREWSEDQLKIIVATVAFGMGINKTDCRCCQILKYFSEVFNRDFCGVPMHQLCDNYSQPCDYEVVDIMHITIVLVRLRFPFSLAMKGSVRMQSAADDQHADFSRSRTAQRSEAARARVCAVFNRITNHLRGERMEIDSYESRELINLENSTRSENEKDKEVCIEK